MYEYVYKNDSDRLPTWRKVYVITVNGDEIGALLSHDAVEAFYSGFDDLGGDMDDIAVSMYLQPMESAEWLTDRLDLRKPTIAA